ncbi:hypothetical protein [Azospirillum palustre]|uniref:hypothetical protein n=1 Tax=Azospirillum palustre TaxID=2044885 RepID=UPI001177C0C3|nr:hypothetical protein [Azospirillum palustre]
MAVDRTPHVRLARIDKKQPGWAVNFEIVSGYSVSGSVEIMISGHAGNIGNEDVVLAEAKARLHNVFTELADQTKSYAEATLSDPEKI